MTGPNGGDASSRDADPGRLLGGRYRLESVAGRGGMATIYRAHDERTGTAVAVKVLRPEIAADRDLADRFRREALAASVLRHPNIVACLDTGTDPVGPYLVMELIEGEDLTTRLRRESTLPPADVARIGLDVARALGVAHERGIVHRDVKPGNILLATDGRALVTDFGIARLADDAEGSVPGTILGSVQYFSPEQAKGEGTTAASDVYGLGLVMYEALTGRRPWSGETSAAIALARIGAPAPSPRATRHEVPVALDAVVVRAMDPDPLRRYPNGTALAAAIERLLVAPAPAVRPPGLEMADDQPTGATTRTAPVLASRRQGPLPAPMLAALGLLGLLVGGVVVAAFPGLGAGGIIAEASDTPRPSDPVAPTIAPTPEPSVAPTPTPEPVVTAAPTPEPVAGADLCEPIFGFPCGLGAGRYAPTRFEPAAAFDLGGGWSTELHQAERIQLVRDTGRLTFLGDVTRIYPKGSEEEARGSLRRVIGRVASTDGTAASKVRGLTIDGSRRVQRGPDDRGATSCRSWGWKRRRSTSDHSRRRGSCCSTSAGGSSRSSSSRPTARRSRTSWRRRTMSPGSLDVR